jgi:glycosyltransferase involved in cell wall biosynthesis
MSRDSSGLCEVRVPTFRRHKLLRRALLSLLEQTYRHWRCVVLDDCPDGSARSIVEAIQDHRIDHLQNPQRLGAVGNIDKSFFRGPMLGGDYAFVLEDDNYLLPDHIERSIGILSENNASVAFCNQYCEMVDVPGEPGRIAKEKTLNWRYQEGIYSPDELLPALFFHTDFRLQAEDFWGSLPQVAGREEPYIRRSASISRGTRRRSRSWRSKCCLRRRGLPPL